MASDTFIILTARDEADRIEATLAALARAFPGARVWVADDGSVDETSAIARDAGASVVRSERPIGKGGAATLAARAALASMQQSAKDERVARLAVKADGDAPHAVGADGDAPHAVGADGDVGIGGTAKIDGTAEIDGTASEAVEAATVAVLCDADLGASAMLLAALADAVRERRADLAVAVFARRLGGGLGLAVGFARWAIRGLCGLDLRAPLSGQRAVRVDALEDLLPFAEGFGMEVGMTIDAARAGHRVLEVELRLEHRATHRTLSGFVHRGRQLLDCVHVYLARR
jgi:glycosyltransferase involved in cell wall biosynthesis